jgi:hypothetical protein
MFASQLLMMTTLKKMMTEEFECFSGYSEGTVKQAVEQGFDQDPRTQRPTYAGRASLH